MWSSDVFDSYSRVFTVILLTDVFFFFFLPKRAWLWCSALINVFFELFLAFPVTWWIMFPLLWFMTDCACNGLEQVFVVATTKKESVRLRLWPWNMLRLVIVSFSPCSSQVVFMCNNWRGRSTFQWVTSCLLCWLWLQVRIARIFNTYGPRMCIDDWSCCQKLCWRRLVNNIVHEWALWYLKWKTTALVALILKVENNNRHENMSLGYTLNLNHLAHFTLGYIDSQPFEKSFRYYWSVIRILYSTTFGGNFL